MISNYEKSSPKRRQRWLRKENEQTEIFIIITMPQVFWCNIRYFIHLFLRHERRIETIANTCCPRKEGHSTRQKTPTKTILSQPMILTAIILPTNAQSSRIYASASKRNPWMEGCILNPNSNSYVGDDKKRAQEEKLQLKSNSGSNNPSIYRDNCHIPNRQQTYHHQRTDIIRSRLGLHTIITQRHGSDRTLLLGSYCLLLLRLKLRQRRRVELTTQNQFVQSITLDEAPRL